MSELTEIIIPADEKSGGAKAAGVAQYIDQRLAEAFVQSERDEWRKQLALIPETFLTLRILRSKLRVSSAASKRSRFSRR